MAEDALAGTGVSVFPTASVRGRARWFSQPADVMSVDDDELGDIVAFVRKPGLTFLSPILGDLKAVVCTAGSPESHLAIVAREYGVPCVMGAELTVDIEDDTGVEIALPEEGPALIRAIEERP